jgi:hypothetical protein
MKDLALTATKLISLVYRENARQLEKWGIQDHDPFRWLAFALEELGELSAAIAEYHFRNGSPEDVVKEAIQAATLCLKIAEMFIAEGGGPEAEDVPEDRRFKDIFGAMPVAQELEDEYRRTR